MTVKDLKERLEQVDDNLIVMISCEQFLDNFTIGIPAKHVHKGFNELDGLLFIDDYEEDDDE